MVAGISTLLIMPIIGKLSDSFDKFKLFAIASIWMIVVVLIYTNLTSVPLYIIMIFNVLMMIGIMSRMVPSMALVSNLPEMHDRGAFMSINSSLQQMAGGIAAGIGGLIVVQKNEFAPLENFNVVGIVTASVCLVGIWAIYRVSKLVKAKPVAIFQPPVFETSDDILDEIS